ncbi:MAG: hypothetical protein H6852_10675 [Geminicoccaceae bacterium]|nr:hypothetical protein [Geminicoccaceae bacterium]HRY22903.1 hypothetical protein [Geminicoccaceae bacterium]
MGAEKAFQALATQLHGADDRTLLKLVAVVDQLAKRGSLDQLLDEHRARLAVIRPPRPMTLGRLVVLPLEELLIDGAEWTPGMTRVPRDRLGRLIELVLEAIDPDLRRGAASQLAGKSMHDSALALDVGREIWPAAGLAADAILARGRQTRDTELRELLTPLRIMQNLMPVAESLVTTIWSLPDRPMLALEPAGRARIGALLALASAQGRDCFLLTAELLVARTELPLAIIEAVLDGELELADRERQQASAMIAEACQNEMVRLFRSVSLLPAGTGPSALVGPLRTLVANLESLQEVAQKVKFDHRELRRLKAEVFTLIEARLEASLGGALLHAFGALDDDTKSADCRALEAHAMAAANMRLMAKRIGLATKIDFVFAKALERFRAILEEAAGPGAGPMGATMDRIRIIELLFDSRSAMQSLTRLRQLAHAARAREPA